MTQISRREKFANSLDRGICRRVVIVATLPLLVAACSGEVVAGLYPGQPVEVDGDVFTVTADSPGTLTLRNFASGVGNQARLFANAGRAARIASGCAVETLTQDPGVNTYHATLDCS